MSSLVFATIGLGAALGAWLRYVLGQWLNPMSAAFPLGTLAANLAGGLLMGAAISVVHDNPSLSPAQQLGLTTGFLGGLTTFSTFSAESLRLAQRGAWWLMTTHLVAHVVGAIVLTWVGFALVERFRG